LRGAVYGMILSGATYTGTVALCFWFCVRGTTCARAQLGNVKRPPLFVGVLAFLPWSVERSEETLPPPPKDLA
jgi:hypothetical protein